MALRLQFSGATDIGCERKENQDRFLIDTEHGLAAVADGMGGLPHGAEAAQCAIDALKRRLERQIPGDHAAWLRLLDTVGQDVFALGLELSRSLGIGTTLTVIHAHTDTLTLAHVGDSALLRLRGGSLEQLSAEHTVAAELREEARHGRPQLRPFAAEHMLTSCLGLPFLPRKDVRDFDLRPGDRLVLCSDGLTKPVELSEITTALERASSPEDAAAQLIDLANRNGGPDNVTVVVLFAGAE